MLSICIADRQRRALRFVECGFHRINYDFADGTWTAMALSSAQETRLTFSGCSFETWCGQALKCLLSSRQTQEILLLLCSCKGTWSPFRLTSHRTTTRRFCAWGQDMDCLQVATKSVEFDKFTRWLIVPWASSANLFLPCQYWEDRNSQASILRLRIYEDLM